MRRAGNAGGRFTPGRSAGGQLAFDLFPAQRVCSEEGRVDAARRRDDVQHGEGERAVGPRIGLQVYIGGRRRLVADRIDDDLGRARLAEPILVHMRRRGRRIGAPNHHALRAVDGARVEAARRFSVHQLQRGVACLVAHRIGVDLGGADTIEELQGKAAGDQRACSRVVGLQDGRAAVAVADRVQTMADIGERLVPADRLKLA